MVDPLKQDREHRISSKWNSKIKKENRYVSRIFEHFEVSISAC